MKDIIWVDGIAYQKLNELAYHDHNSGYRVVDIQRDMLSETKELFIPDQVCGCPVMEIGANSLRNTKFSIVHLPDTISCIGESAFEFSSIEKIDLPKELNSIKQGAFTGCFCLAEININENLKSVLNGAFYSCFNLTKVNIPINFKWEDIYFADISANPLNNPNVLLLCDNETITDLVVTRSVNQYAYVNTCFNSITFKKPTYLYADNNPYIATAEDVVLEDKAFYNSTIKSLIFEGYNCVAIDTDCEPFEGAEVGSVIVEQDEYCLPDASTRLLLSLDIAYMADSLLPF